MNNKKEFGENDVASKDNLDEACFKEQNAINNSSINANIEILKEHNIFIEHDKGVISLSKLYSNRNCENGTFISNNNEKESVALHFNDNIKKPFNESQDSLNQIICNEENTMAIKDKQELKTISNNKNTSLKSTKAKEFNLNELNSSLKKDDFAVNKMSQTNELIYYAVHTPNDSTFPDPTKKCSLHVYTDKEEVLKVVKSNKKARFKQFKTRKEAENFAINGAEITSQDNSFIGADSEKVMPFKRPKTEDIIQFKNFIETGNIEMVKEKIFENPKYLVSNGDTPSILHEGSRYNALHIAAKVKNAEITRLILDTITRIDFIGYLYDDNDIESCLSRSKILLDRYLNTPDKGANETPLHVAVKHGAVQVVQVLLSYSQCQKNNVFNRYNQLPKDMICSRVREPCEEAKSAIASMLEEQYFIPVLRSEDNSLQPRVGEAFSISNPLKLESDLLSPRLEIRAYAGPMSKEKADLFKKKWKTPTRWAKDVNSPLLLRLRDTEKGLEKTGRNLASELNVPWQEYWYFLDTFVDISSEKGLLLLEGYLKKRFYDSFMNVYFEKTDLQCEKEERILNVMHSINDLCEAFEMCKAQDKQSSMMNSNETTSRVKRSSTNSLLIQREQFGKKSNEFLKTYGNNPFIYVERSCEVFGKRIGAAIISCVLLKNHSMSLKESLETQVKHLQTLIKSYREDDRFESVDLQLIHSRVATLAVQSMHAITDENKEAILLALKEIDWSDGALSDDEDINYNGRNHDELDITIKQLYCLVNNLSIKMHEHRENDHTKSKLSYWNEANCKILWTQAMPCKCVWSKNATKKFRSGLKRKSLRLGYEVEAEVSPRKIQSNDDSTDDFFDSLADFSDFNESLFPTPTCGDSDSEEDMEEAVEIPNTFIFAGTLPTKTDYSVLEAIDKVPLDSEKNPYIYLWRHILRLQPKDQLLDNTLHSEPPQKKLLNFESPKSSPCKPLSRSLGAGCESPPLAESVVEPWERVTGPYSPRRSSRSSLSILYYQDSPISR